LERKVQVFNADGTSNSAGEVSHKVRVTVKVGRHVEDLWMFATNVKKVPVVLGHTWLLKHNPSIDWVSGKVTLNRCPPECCSSQRTPLEKWMDKEEASEGWIQALKAWEEKQKEQAKELETSLKEARKRVPKEYWNYIDVFSKKASERMPLQKPWDHAIDLKPTYEPKKGRIIPLSVDKQAEVEGFLEDQLRKGYIRPSNSPQTAPVFFVPKKDGKKRMVQDYWYLNEHTVKNNYLLPFISQLVDKLKGCKMFTKMDLHWGYNNV
jgi:hypothetical protein